MVTTKECLTYLTELLKPELFSDYCPNGLQVQGRLSIQSIVSGVTASSALIEAAIEEKADALLVHHGYFWKGESQTITGIKYHRIKQLLDSQINLIVYHLPLDAHQELGNNKQLAERLGIKIEEGLETGTGPCIAFAGTLTNDNNGENLASHINTQLHREPLYIPGKNPNIRKIACCTGAAQRLIETAYDAGCDAFITGEVSESTVHFARETGMHFYAAGHHATERYGVKALGEHLSKKFNLNHKFIDIDNPV